LIALLYLEKLDTVKIYRLKNPRGIPQISNLHLSAIYYNVAIPHTLFLLPAPTVPIGEIIKFNTNTAQLVKTHEAYRGKRCQIQGDGQEMGVM